LEESGNELWAFKISSDKERVDYYQIGIYNSDEQTFSPKFDENYTYDGGIFYASKTFWDPVKNRRILWGWIAEDYPANKNQ
jgi:beta-fructofuranosidase